MDTDTVIDEALRKSGGNVISAILALRAAGFEHSLGEAEHLCRVRRGVLFPPEPEHRDVQFRVEWDDHPDEEVRLTEPGTCADAARAWIATKSLGFSADVFLWPAGRAYPSEFACWWDERGPHAAEGP